MSFMFSNSVRTNLLLVIMAGILPVLLVILATGAELRQKELHDAEAEALRICINLASQQEAITLGVKQLLSTLANLPEVQSLNVEKCNPLFQSLLQVNGTYGNIVLLNPLGDVIASGRKFSSSNISNFKHVHDVQKNLVFSAGEYQIGSISKIPVFSFAYPVVASSGQLVGILAASVKLDNYYNLFKLISMPNGTIFRVLAHEGVRLVEFPVGEVSHVGVPVKSSSWEEYSGPNIDGHSLQTGEDGVRRHYFYRQLRLRPEDSAYMVFIVGFPEGIIMSKADAATHKYLFWLFFASVLSLVTAYFLGNRGFVSPLVKLANTAKRIGKGELEARTGLGSLAGPIGFVAKSFDALAQELQTREIERVKSETTLKESENKYRTIVEHITDVFYRTDSNGLLDMISPSGPALLGYGSVEEMLGIPAHSFWMDPEKRLAMVALLQEKGKIRDYEFVLRRKDSSPVNVSTSARLNLDEAGNFIGIEGTFRDITERKHNEAALEKSVQKFNSLFDNMAEGVALHSLVRDEHGALLDYVILAVNKSYERILGLNSEDVIGNLATKVYGAPIAPFLDEFSSVALTGKPSVLEQYFQPMGKYFSISIAPWGDGGFSTIFTDVTEQKILEEQLLFRALHDPLTGLANRTLCLDRIGQANERAISKPESTFAVAFIDLDKFKVFNDSLGHEAGDQILREVANRLLSCARRVDTVCRYGGDEFILVLEEVTARETIRTIKRVRESLKTPLTVGEHEIQVDASYGISYAPQGDCQAEDLLRNANIALHCAKLSGRDRIVAFKKSMRDAAIHTMNMQSDMRRGLDSNEFFMVYQPIFNLGNNRLAGFEALIRWEHPRRGIISPVKFIPMAEESGFILELGNFALSQSCKDMVGLLLNLPSEVPLTLSVNISPRQFSRQGFADKIEHALIQSGLPPESLILEITETSIMQYPEASAHILTRLKDKGVGIAIDDFGTGYSSMSALQKLPLDRLKVDMSFVSRVTKSNEDVEIVRAIITLAHSLRLKTVAEGIETEEQRAALRDMHCDLGQGYICSKPILLADVPKAIRQMVCMPNI